MDMSTAEPRFVMPCRCGLVWHTTRSEPIPGERCHGGKFGPIGCDRPLPAPIPLETYERREP
jgi:hypothetical protein